MPAISVPDGELGIMNSMDEAGAHQFVLMDPHQRITATSAAFTILNQHTPVECGGIAVRDEELILAVVARGREVGLAVVDLDEVLGLLSPLHE
jgi:hypothetical protein